MKKMLALLLAAVMLLGALTACGAKMTMRQMTRRTRWTRTRPQPTMLPR